MKEKIRIGFIGSGGISGVHLKSISQSGRAKITCVGDIDSAKTQAKANEFGAKGYTDFGKMLEKEEIEALVLCTPQMVREEPISVCARKMRRASVAAGEQRRLWPT